MLRTLAHEVSGRIRREDTLARYGGEEFAMILPEIDLNHAMPFAEKVRSIVEEGHFDFEGTKLTVTVSVGVTSLSGQEVHLNDFIQAADDNLYAAKEQGRNRVIGPA